MSTRSTLIAVDVGNSRIKLGRFDLPTGAMPAIPKPCATSDLPVTNRAGEFDVRALSDWSTRALADRSQGATVWSIASVHRGAADKLGHEIGRLAKAAQYQWQIRQLTFRDLPLPILVDAPDRVGIDRLLAALAANRLRRPDRLAVVVDLGTAITVDLVSAAGEFCGGAILPGMYLSARALADHTDALPSVELNDDDPEPLPVGKSTQAAMQAGIFWGAVGAIRELVHQYASDKSQPPDVFLTGGAAERVAARLASDAALNVQHVDSLVLSGIALVHEAAAQP